MTEGTSINNTNNCVFVSLLCFRGNSSLYYLCVVVGVFFFLTPPPPHFCVFLPGPRVRHPNPWWMFCFYHFTICCYRSAFLSPVISIFSLFEVMLSFLIFLRFLFFSLSIAFFFFFFAFVFFYAPFLLSSSCRTFFCVDAVVTIPATPLCLAIVRRSPSSPVFFCSSSFHFYYYLFSFFSFHLRMSLKHQKSNFER